MESFQLHLGKDEILIKLINSLEALPRPDAINSVEQNPAVVPGSDFIKVRNETSIKLANEQHLELIPSSKGAGGGPNIEMANSVEGHNAELTPSSAYGFDNSMQFSSREEMKAKAAQLHEMLPEASMNRCKVMLQLYPGSIEEAFNALFEEITEHGPDDGSAETETDDEDGDSYDSNEESETEKEERNPRGSINNLKRRAETPVSS